MREIKFRLRIGNRIVGYERIKPDEDGYLISTYSFDNSIGGWLFEPIKHKNKDEFIGLKDKNGKEIYEGDIIRNKIGIFKVIYRDCCFMGSSIKQEGWYYWEWPTEFFEDCEIIGNIYENPELLKEII